MELLGCSQFCVTDISKVGPCLTLNSCGDPSFSVKIIEINEVAPTTIHASSICSDLSVPGITDVLKEVSISVKDPSLQKELEINQSSVEMYDLSKDSLLLKTVTNSDEKISQESTLTAMGLDAQVSVVSVSIVDSDEDLETDESDYSSEPESSYCSSTTSSYRSNSSRTSAKLYRSQRCHYSCEVPGCKRKFSRPSRLEQHSRIHTGEVSLIVCFISL